VPLTSDGASAPGTPNPVELIVLWGESNAAGGAINTNPDAGGNEGPSAGDLASHEMVRILNNTTLAWERLDVPANHNIDNNSFDTFHGMELGLATEAEGGALFVPVYLVKTAAAGKRIDEWAENGTWWPKLVERMDAATTLLDAQVIPYRITVWGSIGINDWQQGTSQALFVTRMTEFLARFRTLYGADVPFLLTQFADTTASAFTDAVVAANADTYAVSVAGTTYNDDPPIHWDYRGLKTIATRMVDKMAEVYAP
jgi:hypothetical protein